MKSKFRTGGAGLRARRHLAARDGRPTKIWPPKELFVTVTHEPLAHSKNMKSLVAQVSSPVQP